MWFFSNLVGDDSKMLTGCKNTVKIPENEKMIGLFARRIPTKLRTGLVFLCQYLCYVKNRWRFTA